MFSFNCFYFLLRYIQDAVIFLSDFLLPQYSILQLREEFLKFLIVHLYKMFPINLQLSPRLGWFFLLTLQYCSTQIQTWPIHLWQAFIHFFAILNTLQNICVSMAHVKLHLPLWKVVLAHSIWRRWYWSTNKD